VNGTYTLRKPDLDRDAIVDDRASPQSNDFVNRLVKIEVPLSRRRLLDLVTDVVDDVSGAIGIADDVDGDPVFMAKNEFYLGYTKERAEGIVFSNVKDVKKKT